MIRFISFTFSGDKFYREKTVVPLGTPGLTLFRGTNYDAVTLDSQDVQNPPSNGAGKTRLGQILEGFIYGKTARGTFKKMVTSEFEGTLEFEDLRTKTAWSFTLSDGWTVKRNGEVLDSISHKSSDVQDFLQKTIGISRDEWTYFVQIDGDSLRTLIKGKPAERRAYLEDFFQIDDYYEQKLTEYRTLVKQIDQEIILVEQDRVRLNEVEAALDKIAGVDWLERQIEFLDEIRVQLHKQRTSTQARLDEVKAQLDVWRRYYKLSEKYIDFNRDEVDLLLQMERESLQHLVSERKRQRELEVFIKNTYEPHLKAQPKIRPEEPAVQEPEANLLAQKEVQLNKMHEKMSVRLEMREYESQLANLPSDINMKDVEDQRLGLLNDRAEWMHRLSILEKTHGKSECPTCRQDLPDHIKSEDPQTVRLKVKSLNEKLQQLEDKLKQIKKRDSVLNDLAKAKARFDAFPIFGIKIGDLESEIAGIKAASQAWMQYRKLKEKNQDWDTNQVRFETQAKAMGYPDLLEKTFDADIEKLQKSVADKESSLKEASEFTRLLDQVAGLVSFKDLEAECLNLEKNVLDDILKRLEEAAELKGRYARQLDERRTLLKQKSELEVKVAKYDELSKRQRILQLCESCYSPSGFKIYELKQRCKLLVERANYWSQLFFQEPYLWSMNDDLEDLNLFVKPVNSKEDAYPVALLSAGERNRAARVLLFAQLEMIPQSKKTNLLLLDEIEANLDEVGIKAFTDVAIPKLKETFPDRSIVIVSHLKSLKNSGHLDHLWQAERRERQTRLTLQPWYNRRA